MGYRLQMSAEIHDWLAELRDNDPPAAVLAAQALAALADGGDRLGPPLVTAVDGRLRPDELLSALDRHYQARLESMNALPGPAGCCGGRGWRAASCAGPAVSWSASGSPSPPSGNGRARHRPCTGVLTIFGLCAQRQAGYWSCRAHTSTHSSSVNLRPAERISASSVKYSSRGGPGANRMSIRAGAPLWLEKA